MFKDIFERLESFRICPVHCFIVAFSILSDFVSEQFLKATLIIIVRYCRESFARDLINQTRVTKRPQNFLDPSILQKAFDINNMGK